MKKTFFPSLLIALGVLTTTVCNALDNNQVYVALGFTQNTYQVFNNSPDTVHIESLVIDATNPSTAVRTYVHTDSSAITSRAAGTTGSVIRHHTAVAPGTYCFINYALAGDTTTTLKVLVRSKNERCAYIIKP